MTQHYVLSSELYLYNTKNNAAFTSGLLTGLESFLLHPLRLIRYFLYHIINNESFAYKRRIK